MPQINEIVAPKPLLRMFGSISERGSILQMRVFVMWGANLETIDHGFAKSQATTTSDIG